MSLLDLPKPRPIEGKTKTVRYDKDGHIIREAGDDKPGKKLSPWLKVKYGDPQKFAEIRAKLEAIRKAKKAGRG